MEGDEKLVLFKRRRSSKAGQATMSEGGEGCCGEGGEGGCSGGWRLLGRVTAAREGDSCSEGRWLRWRATNEEEMFMASLVCNVDEDCEKLLICKMDLDCVKVLHFDTEMNSNRCMQSSFSKQPLFDSCLTDSSKTFLMGMSPFPSLDVFIESVASVGNISGKIRSWYWFSEYGLVVYSMSRNRYCERIGRQHKSNHVMYVVDLRMAAYYQKCYDPDCRGYRSPLRPIPSNVIADFTNFFKPIEQNASDNNRGNESVVESYKNDVWWLEAIKIADEVENKQKVSNFTDENDGLDEDEDWWMAVERTTSQTE